MNDVLWIFDSWQSLVNTLILFFGFLATIWSIRKNTEARKISLFHDMTKEERAISLKLFEIARDIKNKTYEGKDKEKIKKLKIEEQNVIINQYLNFLEHLALLINEKKIDERITKKYFGSIIKDAVNNYQNKIFPKYTQIIKLHEKWKEN